MTPDERELLRLLHADPTAVRVLPVLVLPPVIGGLLLLAVTVALTTGGM